MDSEEEYYPQEIEKIRADVETRGLGLIVFAEWYNKNMLTKMRFFDDNTRTWFVPCVVQNFSGLYVEYI